MDDFNETTRRIAALIEYNQPLAEIRGRFPGMSEDDFFLAFQAAKSHVDSFPIDVDCIAHREIQDAVSGEFDAR